MKCKVVFLLILLLLPLSVFAEETILVTCDKNIIKNKDEIECSININN